MDEENKAFCVACDEDEPTVLFRENIAVCSHCGAVYELVFHDDDVTLGKLIQKPVA